MRSSTNASIMKEKNKKLILQLIRQQPISRANIAEITGLTKAAVSFIIEDCIKDDIIYEKPSEEIMVGRRPILLYLKPDAGYAFGVSIGRSFCNVGIINILGEVICEKEIPLLGREQTTQNACSILEQMMIENRIQREKVCGVGITMPGPLDSKNQVLLNPPNFSDDWLKSPIGKHFKQLLQMPVFFENDANAFALYEKYYGVAKNSDCFIDLLVNKAGIGSGIVIKNRIFPGLNELGHTTVFDNGIKCFCGNNGCLECYAGISAILKNTKYRSWKEIVDSNDEDLIKKESHYLSLALINAINLFDFDMIVLSGAISYKPQKLIEYLKKDISGKTLSGKNIKISASNLESTVVCAGMLALQKFFLYNV